MKKILLVFITLILFGCSKDNLSKETEEYLKIKEDLLNQQSFCNKDEIPFDLNISIDRINENEISYRAIIDKPKENMYNIKALVIHKMPTEEIFPSIGIFDETVDLIVNDNRIKGISLIGYIKTKEEINSLNLNIKTYIEYQTDEGEFKTISCNNKD